MFIKQINLVKGLEGIKNAETSTKKEWVNIVEKEVDKDILYDYIGVMAPGYEP